MRRYGFCNFEQTPAYQVKSSFYLSPMSHFLLFKEQQQRQNRGNFRGHGVAEAPPGS
jgi:hypothetical protein